MVHWAVEIDAAPAEVWPVLTDFGAFPSWNPFITKASGVLRTGERITVTLRIGRWPVTLRPRLTVVDPPRELRWLARQRVPGLFDVDRRFVLAPIGASRCRFAQSESATGVLAPLLMWLLRRPILDGYQRLGAALKERLERAS